jgi:hypothetical protein
VGESGARTRRGNQQLGKALRPEGLPDKFLQLICGHVAAEVPPQRTDLDLSVPVDLDVVVAQRSSPALAQFRELKHQKGGRLVDRRPFRQRLCVSAVAGARRL